MKGYYIHFDGNRTPGVRKKIKMQTEELGRYFDVSEIEITAVQKNLTQRILRMLPYGAAERNYNECLTKLEQPDFVYIRRTQADRYYIQFLKKIRDDYPECQILIEIYTYPYDKDEFGTWYALPRYCKEIWNRKKIPALIDRYVTVSPDDQLLGKQTLNIANGICVSSVRQAVYEKNTRGRIDMVAVAYMQKQHGYERVIEGLYQYYRNGGRRKVFLHLAGDGPEKGRYQKLVRKRGLEERVLFYPELLGKELDLFFDHKDIAVCALGLYKNHVYYESSLKSREYLARGLPVITGCVLDVFEKKACGYGCSFANDSTAIDIHKVVAFCDALYKSGGECIRADIRRYAEQTVGMESAMRTVVDYLMTK